MPMPMPIQFTARGRMTIRPARARCRIVVHQGDPRPVRGFSLLELMVTLSIVATLAAIAAPRYHGSVARHRLDLAAARLVGDLDLARRVAVVEGRSVTVAFRPGDETYTLEQVADVDRGTADTVVDLAAAPSHLDLVSADFGGDLEVVFDALGQPDSGGTVVLGTGSGQRTVVLDAATRRGTVQ